MNEGNPEQALQIGATQDNHIAIEYSWQTLNEIRGFAIEGLKRPALGAAVGGVLFGARGENLVRILTWRPIRCEHALGPSFQLSQRDRIHLGKFLQTCRNDSELSEMHAVGWFVSHLGSGTELNESDLNVYNHFFPWSWQIALVLEPQRDGSAKAGFFFRDAEGDVKAASSYRQFDVEPEPGQDPASGLPVRDSFKLPTNTQRYHPRAAKKPWLPRDQRVWIWAVPLLLALVVGVMLFSRPAPVPTTPSISFHIVDDGAESRFEWDKQSAPIREAVRGALQIRDGTSNMEVPLETDRLREGKFSYSRKTNDLEVVMTVYPVNTQPIQESARFVGSPVSNAGNDEATAEIRRERDSLADEVTRLKESLRKETVRNAMLEDAMRILQNRVQAEEQRRARPAPVENK